MANKIIACAIVQNEELYAKFAIKSLYDTVDGFVIVDGGSTDKTIQIIKENDPQGKVVLLHSRFSNNYAESRNTYLKFIRERIYNPWSNDRIYYWRFDMDEFQQINTEKMRKFIEDNQDKLGFRFNMATFDKDHFHFNGVAPKETRANLFLFNPGIRYVNEIHETPTFQAGGFGVPLYGGPEGDLELGIIEVPSDIAYYEHAPWCDYDRCRAKAINYTRHYVKRGEETQERLKMIENNEPGGTWWWDDHVAGPIASQFGYPTVLKDAPWMQNPPTKIMFADGEIRETKEEPLLT